MTDKEWERYLAIDLLKRIKNEETHEREIDRRKALDLAIKALEQPKTDWIACSERLPKVEDLHEIGIEHCTCYLIQRRCGVMDVAHYIKVYGESYFEAHCIKFNDVIAWMPLPESYNPGTERKQTNGDRIRNMSNEELTKIILCPYDTAGKPIDIMPCVKDGNIQELVSPEDCKKCMLEWLQSEVEE